MSNVFLGQIVMFGGNFAPRGFAFCNGELLPISQNQALFALLGTSYGGNGVQSFGLPNLQSNLPVHAGQGPGLSNYVLGQTGGTPTVTITRDTMPTHNHALNATRTAATTTDIGATVLPGTPTAGTSPRFYVTPKSGAPDPVPEVLNTAVCGPAGSGQAHTNLMPSLCISFIIALQGIFPSPN
jgi:microcystin-dependent protein